MTINFTRVHSVLILIMIIYYNRNLKLPDVEKAENYKMRHDTSRNDKRRSVAEGMCIRDGGIELHLAMISPSYMQIIIQGCKIKNSAPHPSDYFVILPSRMMLWDLTGLSSWAKLVNGRLYPPTLLAASSKRCG